MKKAANSPTITSKDQRILKLPRSGVAERASSTKKTKNSKSIVLLPFNNSHFQKLFLKDFRVYFLAKLQAELLNLNSEQQ
jgi:hypothetical protein